MKCGCSLLLILLNQLIADLVFSTSKSAFLYDGNTNVVKDLFAYYAYIRFHWVY